jgi:hypothetical protein
MTKTSIITHNLLRSWGPCKAGYKRFCELFPNGADLQTAIDGLIADDHESWARWLFNECRDKGLFSDVISRGYMNSGYRNSGDRNSGDQNSGDQNSGHWNSGDRNSGDRNSGDRNSGDRNSGDQNSGHWNSGDRNSGDRNSGDRNSGDRNSGHRNSGDQNSGHWNSGHWNSGDRNSGDRNSGHRNSGDQNSGDQNSGHWNSGDRNSGYFNSKTPDEILVFNKMCKISDWDYADKPDFIYEVQLTYWVDESDMSDADKIADPHFHVRCGQLRTRTYKEAWKHAWDNADHNDRMSVMNLPNFDADVFYEITGIDLRESK